MGARRLCRSSWCRCVRWCACCVAVRQRSRARGDVFSASFGAPGSGDGQLDEPSGVAVNESTGDVYVV